MRNDIRHSAKHASIANITNSTMRSSPHDLIFLFRILRCDTSTNFNYGPCLLGDGHLRLMIYLNYFDTYMLASPTDTNLRWSSANDWARGKSIRFDFRDIPLFSGERTGSFITLFSSFRMPVRWWLALVSITLVCFWCWLANTWWERSLCLVL